MAVKKNKRPTLKTIAYMTGLGVTTVSKALKDASDIKASTKERVKLIAEQIGYQPDRTGLRLRTGKTNVISLALRTDEEVTSMTSQFIAGILEALQHTQYTLVLSPYVRDSDPMESVRHIVESRGADGIILSRIESTDKRLAYLDEAGMPFATHGRSNMGLNHAFFDFDCERFAADAARLLVDKGCGRLGLVSAPLNFSYGQCMRNGFDTALQETGIEESRVSARLGDSIDVIADCVGRLMKQKHNRPDGFVCGNVEATVGVIAGVENAGLVVGEDVRIVAKQPSASLLKWLGRPVYGIEDDLNAAGFGVATSLINVIDGAPVEDNQTIVYPETWGNLVADTSIQN